MVTEEIDVVKLYAGLIPGFVDAYGWNKWLTQCLETDNLNQLLSVRRGLQKGMDSARKKKLVDEKLAVAYSRWIGSIDKTIRRVVKNRDRLQNDFVNNKGDAKSLREKRERDAALEAFLKKESY